MAIVTIPAEMRQIKDTTEIKRFLADYGIEYDIWPLEDRVNPAAPADDILSAYKPEIDVLKEKTRNLDIDQKKVIEKGIQLSRKT